MSYLVGPGYTFPPEPKDCSVQSGYYQLLRRDPSLTRRPGTDPLETPSFSILRNSGSSLG